MTAKLCRTCGDTKPLSEFYSDRSKADGRRHACKSCTSCRRSSRATMPPEACQEIHLASIAEANLRRSAAAGVVSAERARKALEILGTGCPPRMRPVAEKRAQNPAASWADIAAELGTTKDVAYGLFRRLLERAELSS